MRQVPADRWVTELAVLSSGGWSYLDLLTAIDRGTELEVVARVVDPSTAEGRFVTTRVPVADPRLPSATSVYPAAAWHEREAAEMFGLVFDGHPDPRPLLRRTAAGRPPLRKDVVLAARVVTPWPGAAEDESGRAASRRRQRPPGVPESWLREDA